MEFPLFTLLPRHQETNSPLLAEVTASQPELPPPILFDESRSSEAPKDVPSHADRCKVAKVHTWLKNKSYSDLDQLQSVSLDDHAHSQGHTSLNDHAPLRVHFADEEACTCADDTKSIGSSHTSGIVTDCPISPKLLPNCSCQKCSSQELGEFPGPNCHVDYGIPSMPSGPDILSMPSGHAGSGVLSMPSGGELRSLPGAAAISIESSSSESTLCPPSSISVLKTPPTTQSSIKCMDTAINQPPVLPTTDLKHCRSVNPRRPIGSRKEFTSTHSYKLSRSFSHLNHHSIRVHSSGRDEQVKEGKSSHPSNSETNREVPISKSSRRCPEPPSNVCVSQSRRRGEALVISWKPVK